jgi:hypothetical protein
MRQWQAIAAAAGNSVQRSPVSQIQTETGHTNTTGTTGLTMRHWHAAAAVNNGQPSPVLQIQTTQTVHPAFPWVKRLLSELMVWCGKPPPTIFTILNSEEISGCVEKLASTFINDYIPHFSNEETNKLQTWLQELKSTPHLHNRFFLGNKKIMIIIRELLKTLAKENKEKEKNTNVLDRMADAFVHRFIVGHQCECTWLKGLVAKCQLQSPPLWWFGTPS